MSVRKTDPWWVRLLSWIGVDVVFMTREDAAKFLTTQELKVIIPPQLVYPPGYKGSTHVDGEARNESGLGTSPSVRELRTPPGGAGEEEQR